MQYLIPAILLILWALPVQTAAQDVEINPPQEHNQYYVDATKPGVYLRREQETDTSKAHFRLFNNSRWAIMLRVDRLLNPSDAYQLQLQNGRLVSGINDSMEILAAYFIESPLIENGLIMNRWCTALDAWIPSGQSVRFTVPLKDLPKLAEIYLQFHYEWEHEREESEHRVKFRWLDPSLIR
jgi:hypothetical protein